MHRSQIITTKGEKNREQFSTQLKLDKKLIIGSHHFVRERRNVLVKLLQCSQGHRIRGGKLPKTQPYWFQENSHWQVAHELELR